jgi:ABC-type Mn2+/Zn2+ transport system permease subunit
MMTPMHNLLASMLHDFIAFGFWRNGVIGGLIIAVVCSVLSVYVVLKRMAFVGQGISHSAFGGVALGALLFSGTAHSEAFTYLTALVFCLAVALLIGATTRHSRISEDSAIGIFFVVSMALGVIFFKVAKGFNQDVFSFLFGSILALSPRELALMAVLAAGVLLPVFALQKELLYYTFDEGMASVSGIPVAFLHYMLLALLALTIVISVRMVGIVLISAFLILPGAIAQLLTFRFNRMILLSVVTGVATTVLGLMASWYTDWPTGATIVVVQFAVFVVLFVVRRIQGTLSV